MKLHAVVEDLETARIAVAGGATVVQLRLKDAPTRDVIEQGAPFRELPATFIVNDDVEAAIALAADGVHLGQTDAGAELALATGLLLGRSASTVEEAIEAEKEGAAYIGASPVWATPSKTDTAPALGLDGLAAICKAVSIPVVAIGSVDASNAADCIRAGAAGVAVIRAARDSKAIIEAIDAAF